MRNGERSMFEETKLGSLNWELCIRSVAGLHVRSIRCGVLFRSSPGKEKIYGH